MTTLTLSILLLKLKKNFTTSLKKILTNPLTKLSTKMFKKKPFTEISIKLNNKSFTKMSLKLLMGLNQERNQRHLADFLCGLTRVCRQFVTVLNRFECVNQSIKAPLITKALFEKCIFMSKQIQGVENIKLKVFST